MIMYQCVSKYKNRGVKKPGSEDGADGRRRTEPGPGFRTRSRTYSPALKAATTPIPLPRASLSFLVKQPGGLGCKLHSKCSKCKAAHSQAATGTRLVPISHGLGCSRYHIGKLSPRSVTARSQVCHEMSPRCHTSCRRSHTAGLPMEYESVRFRAEGIDVVLRL